MSRDKWEAKILYNHYKDGSAGKEIHFFIGTDEFPKLESTKHSWELDHNFHYEIKGIITLKGKKNVVLISNASFYSKNI